jgi:uncharacterized RDD family membrane protein YckC
MKKLASKRYRMLAFVIDYLIFVTIFSVMCVFYGEPSEEGVGYVLSGTPAFITTLIGVFLWPFSEAFSGQTIGKRLVGIKVVNESFREIKTSQAFVRFIFGFIDFSCLFVGLIVASNNKNNQRIGDQIAKTLVIDINKTDAKIQ